MGLSSNESEPSNMYSRCCDLGRSWSPVPKLSLKIESSDLDLSGRGRSSENWIVPFVLAVVPESTEENDDEAGRVAIVAEASVMNVVVVPDRSRVLLLLILKKLRRCFDCCCGRGWGGGSGGIGKERTGPAVTWVKYMVT